MTEHYQIEDSPGGETTSLEIVDGADMRGQISALEHSFVKISGGQKISANLNLLNDSTGEIIGGFVQSVQTFQNSTLTISNGTINQLTAREDSSVSIFKVSLQNHVERVEFFKTETFVQFDDTPFAIDFEIGTGDFPAAPTVLNFSTTQTWDHTQEVTLHWNPMPGGTVDDVIYFHIGGFADWFEAPIARNGLATSITIPANTLPLGQALDAELVFVRPSTNDTTLYPGVRVISGLASATRFFIETLGDPLEPEVVVQHDGTMATVKVIGELGQVYDVYRSDNLADWHYFDTLWFYDDRSGFLGSSSFKDDSPSDSKQQFYRLE